MPCIGSFTSSAEYKLLAFAVSVCVLSECGIFLFTILGSIGKGQAKKRSDRGTVWLVIIGWYFSIWVDSTLRNPDAAVPSFLNFWLLPYFFLYVGLFFSAAGIVLRYTAVFTLKRAFTLSVQTAGDQHLIQKGLYGIVRNPAYTGSIISLLGFAIAFRNIFGIIALLIPLLCYALRIRVEEKTLQSHFGKEFETYCQVAKYRLFPGIY